MESEDEDWSDLSEESDQMEDSFDETMLKQLKLRKEAKTLNYIL